MRRLHFSSRALPLLLCLTLAGEAGAQPASAPAGELSRIQQAFEFGDFAEVVQQAEARLDFGGLAEEERRELHRLAGLAAFNLNQPQLAERHFRAVLRIDPDAELDPFLVPPPAIAFFAKIRESMREELEGIREQRRAMARKAELARKEEERRRVEAEEQRRRLEAMARQVIVRTHERRSIFVNFIPFGVGQFQQGRVGTGLAFAAGQVALAATSVLAFFAYENLLVEQEITIDDRLDSTGGRTTRKIRGIPQDRLREANLWRNVKLATGLGFYGLWAAGSAEALWRHEEIVTTEQTLPGSAFPPPPAQSPPGRSSGVSAQPRVFALPGGGGAGFALTF